jgi:hypothetical protein
LIFGKRKKIPAKEKTHVKQDSKFNESYISRLDNIEFIREAPEEDNGSPKQFNRDLMDLVLVYMETEKRVLNLR